MYLRVSERVCESVCACVCECVCVGERMGLPVMPSELYYEHTVMHTLKRMAEREVSGR